MREDEFLVELEKCLKKAYLDAKIGVDPAENEPQNASWNGVESSCRAAARLGAAGSGASTATAASPSALRRRTGPSPTSTQY